MKRLPEFLRFVKNEPEFEAHWIGGVLIVSMLGPYDLGGAARLRAFVGNELSKRQAVKVLADLRRAVILLKEDEMPELVAQSCTGDRRAAVGLLVDQAHSGQCWTFCAAMIVAGYTRVPFSSPEDAKRWLGFRPEDSVPALSPFRAFRLASEAG